MPGKIIEAPPIAVDWETKPGHKLHVSRSSGNLPHNSVPHSGSVPHSSSASGLSRWHTHQQQQQQQQQQDQQPDRSSSRTRLEVSSLVLSAVVLGTKGSCIVYNSREPTHMYVHVCGSVLIKLYIP